MKQHAWLLTMLFSIPGHGQRGNSGQFTFTIVELFQAHIVLVECRRRRRTKCFKEYFYFNKALNFPVLYKNALKWLLHLNGFVELVKTRPVNQISCGVNYESCSAESALL